MDKLVDYIRWMGDFPISATGLRDVDAVILCALSYFDFSPLFSAGGESYRVRDCQQMIENDSVKVLITGGDKGYPELLALAAASRRFGELTMSDYRDIYRQDPPLQFSALCFHDDSDFSFLAYRGTDSSLAGWEEDFRISFTRTEAQEMALRYANEHIRPGRRWYMGGHSKGSNLALYAACLLDEEKWAAVEHLYLLDGPGFCPEVMKLSLVDRIDSKTTRIVPRFCIVGNLFAPKIHDTRIIQSAASGFMQHSIITWEVDHGGLALAENFDPIGKVTSEALDEWISDINQEDRTVLVMDLFETLAAGGAEMLEEIRIGDRNGMEAIIRRLGDSSESTKKMLIELPKYARRARLEKLRKLISALPAEVGLTRS